jgi:hypothetical protein
MAATLITGTDLTARKDARTIADLISDSGSPVAETAVPNHPKVIVALEDAEGEVVGNLQAFGRYTIESLSLLTGSAQSFLKRVIAEIAMINLIVRRPDLSSEDLERHEKIRSQWLERLQQGNMILADENTDDSASRVSIDGATLGETANLNMVRDRSRYFPTRVYPNGRNY